MKKVNAIIPFVTHQLMNTMNKDKNKERDDTSIMIDYGQTIYEKSCKTTEDVLFLVGHTFRFGGTILCHNFTCNLEKLLMI